MKHCKDAFATNGLCPAELGIVRVLRVSAVLPGALWSLGVTLTPVVTKPFVSVFEQQLKTTGKLPFPKGKDEVRGRDCTALMAAQG